MTGDASGRPGSAPEWDAADDIDVLDLRDAVRRRPLLWFGTEEPAEWPLVLVADALTALTSRRSGEGDGGNARVCVTDGEFMVSARVRALEWWRSGVHQTLADHLRARFWWHPLCSDLRIEVSDSSQATTAHGDRHVVVESAQVSVSARPDPMVFGPSTEWWTAWTARLTTLLDDWAE